MDLNVNMTSLEAIFQLKAVQTNTGHQTSAREEALPRLMIQIMDVTFSAANTGKIVK